jgi:hypothetical protein
MKTNIRIYGSLSELPKFYNGKLWRVSMESVSARNKAYTVFIEGDSEADVRESAETIYENSSVRAIERVEDYL